MSKLADQMNAERAKVFALEMRAAKADAALMNSIDVVQGAVVRAERAEAERDAALAEVARLREAIDHAVSSLTPDDVSRIKSPGFMALLELSAVLRTTSAPSDKSGGTP